VAWLARFDNDAAENLAQVSAAMHCHDTIISKASPAMNSAFNVCSGNFVP
jgi:hypothetical protein